MKKNIFLFHGDDTYASLNQMRLWLKVFLKKYPESSILKINADELDLDKIIQQIETNITSGSLFAREKLLVIKRLLKNKKIFNQKDFWPKINQIINQIDETTFLIFWEEGEVFEKKFLNFFQKNSHFELKLFNQPNTPQLFQKWLTNEIIKRNLIVSEKFITDLSIRLGRDLIRHSKGKKILPYDLKSIAMILDSFEAISVLDPDLEKWLDQLVEPVFNVIIFDLTDSIVKKNLEKSLNCLDQLRKQNNDPFFIFSMIVWQFRQIMQIVCARESSIPEKMISQTFQILPYIFQKIQPFAKKVSFSQINKIYQKFLNFDYQSKTGFEPDWQLEKLIINLCRV